MPKPVDIIVFAAGGGRRLRAGMPKPLAVLAGRPLIAHVLAAAAKIAPRRIIVVVPPGAPELRDAARRAFAKVEFAVQKEPRGTADAARQGAALLGEDGVIITACADAPLVQAATLQKMRRAAAGGALAFMCFRTENPRGYGRIVRSGGEIVEIVEEKDADAARRKIGEVFGGALAAEAARLKPLLSKLRAGHAAGELYLTQIAEIARRQNIPAKAVFTEKEESLGVNTPGELAAAAAAMRRRRAEELMARGVRIADPLRLDVRGEVRAGRDVEIDVNVILSGEVALGRGCQIGANCIIGDCEIGAGAQIAPFCHLHGAKIGARCAVGPFARIRPQTRLKTGARIGNFVEIKNTEIGAAAKAAHLAYLGDAEVGDGANIGAGVITCNYDGKKKHRTIIGAGAFIGSDVQLIAPVRVGRGAYIAAGTTLAKDAPADKLTWSRVAQTSRGKKR